MPGIWRRVRPLARFANVIAVLAVAAAPAGQAAPGPAGCGTGSWIGGVVELCNGELVHRDYIYDDYGANTGAVGASSTGSLSNPTGDVRYPGPDPDNNYADLVELRLAIVGARLHVRFVLNSMTRADSTVAVLAIDTDDNALTGGGPWPGLTTNGGPLTSSGWDELHAFSVGDPATNSIEGSVRLPPGSRWRLQAATAIAASGVVMNVAFRGTSESGNWFEDAQAAALATGDVSAFGHTVDVADLVGGVTRPAVVPAGYHERVYTSDFTVALDPNGRLDWTSGAEGVHYAGIPGRGEGPSFGQEFHFLGRNQPYGIYIPSGAPPYGVQLVMHGYSANHASLIEQPGMQQNVGDARNRILVVPLGRGPAGFYSDISERDVLDVLADVEANYPVDLERVFAGGYSMGGYGTYRFATLYPQRFAGFISWVGFPGDACEGAPVECPAGAVGNAFDFFGNLRWVPGAMLYAGEDELVNAHQGITIRNRFAELVYPHIFYFHPAAEHLTFALLDDWRKESVWTRDLVRVTHPERVTYRMEPFLWDDVLGIRHDRAYWVSDLRGHQLGENDYVDVDVRTFGCGSDVPRTELDPPGTGTDPVPWESQSASIVGFDPIVQSNRIEAALANVQSLTLDTSSTAGACLGPAPIEYQITTDAPATIAFGDGRVLTLPGPGTHTGSVGPLDSDHDGIPDDGDGSNVARDAPCAGGQASGCDDNCPTTPNPGQADADADAIGDDCDRCPRRPTPPKRCR